MVLGIGLATISPAPVGGRVSFQAQDGTLSPAINQLVTLENIRTLEVVTVYTSNAGEFLVDWANTALKYQSGDVVTVSVLGVTQQVQLPDADLLFINVNSLCPIIPECPTCPDCPTCPEPIKCDSCCPVPTSPQFDWTLFFGGGITVLVVFLGSAALYFKAGRGRLQVYKKYMKADGTIGKKWVTVTALNWGKLKDNEVY